MARGKAMTMEDGFIHPHPERNSMDIMTTGVLPQTGEKIVVPDPEPGFDAGTYGGHTTTAAGTGYAQTTQTQQPRLSNGKQFEKADVARTVTKISGAVEVEMGLEDV